MGREDPSEACDALDVGAAWRAMPGQGVCGDRVGVWRGRTHTTVAVVDGVGHGPLAAAAAETAMAVVARQLEASPAEILTCCDSALRGSCGVVMSVCRFALGTGVMVHAGIGNIGLRHLGTGLCAAAPLPGIVGARMRRVHEQTSHLDRGDLLLLYTDGVSSRFELEPLRVDRAQDMADAIVARYAKPHDDAGCAVVLL
jgi:hypothetical protein